MKKRLSKLILGIVLGLTGAAALTDDFDLDWYTIDAGGEMWTSGGDFELSGTIGQADASAMVMTGGDFELAGGFWVIGRAAVPKVSPSYLDPDERPDEPTGAEPAPTP